MLNKIITATLAAGSKAQVGGCLITFITTDIIGLDNILSITTPDEKKHYFAPITVSAGDDDEMAVIANETGYFAWKIERIKGFDLRTLVDLPVSIVTDEEELKKVREQSSWC